MPFAGRSAGVRDAYRSRCGAFTAVVPAQETGRYHRGAMQISKLLLLCVASHATVRSMLFCEEAWGGAGGHAIVPQCPVVIFLHIGLVKGC